MEIKIEKVDSHEVNGDPSDVITTYLVRENGKGFRITCRSCRDRRTLGIAGKEGSLYIEKEDNTVRRQVVALGGGCGLLIDEEPVEGLSPLALRGVLMADQGKSTREVVITGGGSDGASSRPLVLIDGIAEDLPGYF
ncbi:hypothetical protein [Syntrophorhabdus aromaticivorans]|jgi:hypothetical protein|uniref:Uncharacterized protein n=1 Tax=Syntrophorhabdus aromaticivorans TaxID=328301 RepID=A0A351U4F8_9BACT|nr:hypothetical protein [Syntrophorhabdus aromaticivorans]NLW34010.1 hypothetical protein [Syntrophorhabdus aromaticivorans]HBA54839.1 hypothetical protein [Syntrophorhabdus aromaticivorans]